MNRTTKSLKQRVARMGKRFASHLPPGILRVGYSLLDLVLPAYLHVLKRSKKPVIVGPWTSEVGHELLYWIPFLENLKQKGVLCPEKTFVISRGGNSIWYKNITDNYYNIFCNISIETYKESVKALRSGKLEKRLLVDAFDREILQKGVNYFGYDRYHLLHPMVMNNLLMPVWKGDLPVALEEKHIVFQHFPQEDVDLTTAGLHLDPSEDYVAVKFYFNRNFPENQTNVDFVNRVIETLARRYKVLVLQLESLLDNHNFPQIAESRNIIDCRTISMTDNLRFQTALIRQSKYLVSTFGGFSFLPAFLGQQSFAFYSGTFGDKHVALGFKLFDQLSPHGLKLHDSHLFAPVLLPE